MRRWLKRLALLVLFGVLFILGMIAGLIATL